MFKYNEFSNGLYFYSYTGAEIAESEEQRKNPFFAALKNF
jgi:hypothetical protein